MTIYAPTYCPETSPCNPCCFQLRADQTKSTDRTEYDADLGSILLCAKPFVWPFVNRTVIEPATGNSTGYFPIGLNPVGANSPSGGGSYLDSVIETKFYYLGSVIFDAQVTSKFVGQNYPNGWASVEISCNPAPTNPFAIKYADALSIANQAGLTIRQFFGDYTQADPVNNSPIQLTGFVYTGSVDNTQDKVLSATVASVSVPAISNGFWQWGVIYYSPQPVAARIRSRVRLVGRII